MTSATRTVTAVFRHPDGPGSSRTRRGEILQGRMRPAGLVIQSWPDTPFFRIESGEPAMTIIPNLLVAGMPSTVRRGEAIATSRSRETGQTACTPASGSRTIPDTKLDAAAFGLPGRIATVIKRTGRPSRKPFRV